MMYYLRLETAGGLAVAQVQTETDRLVIGHYLWRCGCRDRATFTMDKGELTRCLAGHGDMTVDITKAYDEAMRDL